MRVPRTAHALLILMLAAHGALPSTPQEQSTQPDPTSQRIAEAYQALEADDLERAARAFREALALAPDAVPALLGLSWVLERQGDSVEALGLARRAVALAPESSPALLTVARLLARLGASAEALEILSRLRVLDSEQVQGYLLAAFLLQEVGRRGEGIQVLEEALAHGLRGPELEEELAILLVAEDRPGEARRLAEEALAAYGERAGLHLALGLSLAADPTSRGEAVLQLERALELGVGARGRVHLELGKLLLEAEQPLEAVEHLKRAAELVPESTEALYRLAAAQRAVGDSAGAQYSLTRFQELTNQREGQERLALEVGTALNEAQELATANRLPEALERVELLLAEQPDNARAHTLKAKILYSMERPEEALVAAVRARELAPTRVEPHYVEGMFLLDLGRPQEARTALARAVALNPRLGEAYVLLGGAAAKLAQPLEAVAHFERALELGADSPALRLGYAAVLESLGRLEESAQQLEAYRRLAERPE